MIILGILCLQKQVHFNADVPNAAPEEPRTRMFCYFPCLNTPDLTKPRNRTFFTEMCIIQSAKVILLIRVELCGFHQWSSSSALSSPPICNTHTHVNTPPPLCADAWRSWKWVTRMCNVQELRRRLQQRRNNSRGDNNVVHVKHKHYHNGHLSPRRL